MAATAPSQARITAAIAAAQQCGLPIAGVEIDRDGTLRILATPTAYALDTDQKGNSCDELFSGKSPCET